MEEDAWLPWRVTEPGRGSQGNVSVGCQVKVRDTDGEILKGRGRSLSPEP